MSPRFAAVALGISAGIVVWALHFAAIYGATALACARHAPGLVAPVVGGASVLAVAALALIAVRGWRRRASFEHWLAATVAGFALLAVAWETLPVALVTPCG